MEKRREFHLESRLVFLENIKVFDRVKRDKLFEKIIKSIPNLSLKRVVEMYHGNKIKVKIDNQLQEKHTINHGFG